MPSAFRSKPYTQLNLGVNLRGMTGGVNMAPGEAHDVLDMLPRDDGAVMKHWGWERANTSALTGRPVGVIGFTYKGKNNAVTGSSDTARPGNFGIADVGPDFTRRGELYSGALVLTDSTVYRWEPATQAFVSVSLPASHSVDLHPKPSFIIYNNNVYICGYTTSTSSSGNMRYDPVDEILYAVGWESIPTAATVAASAGSESLLEGAVYKYGMSYLDIYTGEESPIIESAAFTATSTGEATLTLTRYTEATEGRHFNTNAVATDSDVGAVLYRTDADGEQLNFLAVVPPGTTTVIDQGAATDPSIRPYYVFKQGKAAVDAGTAGEPLDATDAIPDEPDFNFWTLFKDQFYAVSHGRDYANQLTDLRPTNINRVYWNDFSAENSFVERYTARGYRELPLPEGEILTAMGSTNAHLIPFTQKGAYAMSVTPNYQTGTIGRVSNRLPWNVGCIGASAWTLVNGWMYFLSERGPYRFRSGMGDPQWIGKNLLPLFIDNTSGLCKLNAGMMGEAEIDYDSDANVVRWAFACGSADFLNTNLMYWVDSELLPAPFYGWYFASPMAQCFDKNLALGPLNSDGTPPSPKNRVERMVFGDSDGYINVYEPASQRAGLPSGSLVTGTVVSGNATTVTLTTAANPLLSQDDGLANMRFEIVKDDDSIEVRRIASNTATAVTLSTALQEAPSAGETWYVAGIPAFWRSWVDHLGMPHDRKSMLHLYLTYLNTRSSDVIDVTVLSGDRGLDDVRSRTASLSDYNEKMLISRTGLYFTYEVANTRPDELFTLVALEPEFKVLGRKRQE